MKVTYLNIMSFVYDVTNTVKLKKKFTNKWFDKESMYYLFLHVNEIESKVSWKTFTTTLNYVAESKSCGLHHKTIWNHTNKVREISTHKNIVDVFYTNMFVSMF